MLNCRYTLVTVLYPFLITRQLWFECDTSQCPLPVTELPFKVLSTSLATAFFRWGQLVNKYSMCTVTPILSHTSDASILITLVPRPILSRWVWVATRLHLNCFASHSWHSSLNFQSWITSHFCEPGWLRLLYTMHCAVNTQWRRHSWVMGDGKFVECFAHKRHVHMHGGLTSWGSPHNALHLSSI